jgi:hypothetical protein
VAHIYWLHNLSQFQNLPIRLTVIIFAKQASRVQSAQIKEDEVGGACSTHVVDGKCLQNFSQKTRSKRPLRRSMRTWEDNVKMDQQNKMEVQIGLIWLRMGMGGGVLWARK